MKVLLSWSSGKDSAWALHVLRAGGVNVAGLLTTFNEAADRVAMHAVRHSLVRQQAVAVALPLHAVPIPSPCPNEIYEERMRQAVGAAIVQGFTHVAFGDLFLEDVRRYREDRLQGTGLSPLFPLWGRPTHSLAREMTSHGLQAVLTCVDPRVLDRTFAGRRFDAALLDELPVGVDPCGERGEFHTFCFAGPMFPRPLAIATGTVLERDGFVFCDVVEAEDDGSRRATSPPAASPA